MDFSWSHHEQKQRDVARQFAQRHLRTSVGESGFSRVNWEFISSCGVFEVDPPQIGSSVRSTAMWLEALGSGGANRGLLFAAGAHFFGCTLPIAQFGSTQQIKELLPSLVNGSQIGCLAITEPHGGSNLASLRTLVSKQNDSLILNGTKKFVTNGPVANIALVIASEFPNLGSLGLSAFTVPVTSSNVAIKPLEAIGLAGAPAAEISFHDLILQNHWRLGPPGGGLSVLLKAMQFERTAILSGFLGAAEHDLSRCFSYLSRRSSTDNSLKMVNFQVVKHRMAEVRCQIESARWLLYRGIWEVENGTDQLIWPAIVKKSAGDLLAKSAQDLLSIYAGAGWLNIHNSMNAVQDTLAALSASGTSDIQLNTIASQLSKTMVPLSDSNDDATLA